MLSLLFDGAAQPDASSIHRLAASGEFAVSHDPPPDSDGNWLELLVNGLTFDLKGLAPGNAEIHELHANLFDLPPGFNAFQYAALTLTPGPHLAAGAAMMPVVRSQMWLAMQLCELPGIVAVGWLPARTLSGPGHFRRSVTRWLEGGAFPALGLTALLKAPDGGMQSEGLAFFTGQELRLEPEIAGRGAGSAQLALRLIHELVERGPIERPEGATGPDGAALRLDPSPNRRFVRVSAA
ncbi:MAG: hypothetical protein J7496_10795 [Novosphingobium sp.]|nr:hypothetical protein [Novosphingobium sp.]MBO9602982.1 hypothetical protein [Novosphingobium sp.]